MHRQTAKKLQGSFLVSFELKIGHLTVNNVALQIYFMQIRNAEVKN